MASTLCSIPIELQLSVYGFLSDLDDALYLSQTCRTLRSVHQMHKSLIERQIITTSDVYERDACLLNLLKVNSDLAHRLFRSGNPIAKDQRRLLILRALDCHTQDWKAQRLTDEEIGGIATRWRQLSYIRHRYLDRYVAPKFENFEAAHDLDSWHGERAEAVYSGIHKPTLSSRASHICRVYSSHFKADFHKSLVLECIAHASRWHASSYLYQWTQEWEDIDMSYKLHSLAPTHETGLAPTVETGRLLQYIGARSLSAPVLGQLKSRSSSTSSYFGRGYPSS